MYYTHTHCIPTVLMYILVTIELYVRVMIMIAIRKFVFPTWVELLTPTYSPNQYAD